MKACADFEYINELIYNPDGTNILFKQTSVAGGPNATSLVANQSYSFFEMD